MPSRVMSDLRKTKEDPKKLAEILESVVKSVTSQDISSAFWDDVISEAEYNALITNTASPEQRKRVLRKVAKAKYKQVKKQQQAKTSAAERVAKSVAMRAELGKLPAVVNQERRNLGRLDLKFFLTTYMPSVFYREFDADALRLIRDIQEAMIHGGRKAIARPRGGGKTAIALGSVLWSALYAHRKYLVLVAATAPLALQMIKDAVAYLCTEELEQDFPEVCVPILAVDGKTQRCRYQTYNGLSTHLEMTRDRLVLATLNEDDGTHNANAGICIQAISITGALRGLHITDSDNRWIRPDFALLDDPQTRESAVSTTQTDERERIVNGDIMGLAGHDTKIASIMCCTIIEKNDLAERFLDNNKHPEWRGQRTKLVEAWGGSEKEWQAYDDIYKLELAGAVARGSSSNYYSMHREALETGSKVLCDSLYADGEISALQHARNFLIENGEYAFMAECQNEPLSRTPQAEYTINERIVAEHLTYRNRGEVREDYQSLVVAIDINLYAISFAVIATTGNAVYEVVDYGWWLPKGKRAIWSEEDPMSLQASITDAVQHCVQDLMLTKPYSKLINAITIDAGYEASTIYACCTTLARQYRGKRIIPSRGLSGDKYGEPSPNKLIRQGVLADYRKTASAVIMFWDSHHYHMQAQRGFLLPVSVSGAVGVYGKDPKEHSIFASQICADVLERTYLTPYGKCVAVWRTTGKNEMSDVVAMGIALLSCEGFNPIADSNIVPVAAPNAQSIPNANTTSKQNNAFNKQFQRPTFRRGSWVGRW